MRTAGRLMGMATVAAVLVGCGEAPGSGDPTVAPPEYRLDPIVRIGALADAPPEHLFSFVIGLDVDQVAGEIYVSDRDAREIRVFSRAGEFLRRIGGPGDGPAEFDRAPEFGVAGDTLVALDRSGLHLFRTDGRHLRTESYRTVSQATVWGSVERTRSGWRATTLELGGAPDAPPYARLYGMDFSEMQLSEPLAEVELPPRQDIYLQQRNLVTAGDGWIVSDELDYRLVRYRPDAPPDTLEFDVTPIVPTPAAFDAWGEAQRIECMEYREGAWCDEQIPGWVDNMRAIGLPPVRPVIGMIRVSPEGDLLVERKDLDPEPFAHRSPRRWDVIRDGQIVGRLRTPERFRASWFGGDEIWAAETDDLGVDYVVGYRVIPPGA